MTDEATPPKPRVDLSILKACVRSLDKSTSRRMLKANLEFLVDRYIGHPSPQLPEHLRL